MFRVIQNQLIVPSSFSSIDKSPLDIFTLLSNFHHLDILKTSGNVFPKIFYPDIDCPYSQHLFAIMLLKASNIFDPNGKLERVENIHVGSSTDPNICGIRFIFNNTLFEFSGSIKNHVGLRIPHDEKQIEVLKLMHKMDMPYAMLYSLDKKNCL